MGVIPWAVLAGAGVSYRYRSGSQWYEIIKGTGFLGGADNGIV